MERKEEKMNWREGCRKLIRVAAYIRVSSEQEAQLESYEKQQQYFEQQLRKNPEWISAGIYCDYGISATSEKKRTGFRRLLRHCRAGKIDRIICKSISRFARNTVDFMEAIDLFRENNVTIYFEKENLDTAESFSAFILTTLGAIAQEESRSISENIRWGKEKRYRKGEDRNYALYGYRFCEGKETYFAAESGYRYRAVEIVSEEADIVRRIYREFLEGAKMVEIALGLNRDKVPAPPDNTNAKRKRKRQEQYVRWAAGKGHMVPGELGDRGWTAMMIGHILRMERYTGDALLQKFYVADYMSHTVRRNRGELPSYLSRNHHPGIIDRETFKNVQVLLSANPNYGRTAMREEKPFSGLLVCAYCGRHYHVRSMPGREAWYCPSTKRHNGNVVCGNNKVPEKTIAWMLRKAVTERFQMMIPIVDLAASGGKREDCVEQLLVRLEMFQRMDSTEDERAYIRKELMRLQQADPERQRESEGECLCELEQYWRDVEKTFEKREEALEWMKRIPRGPERMSLFLDGISVKYAKALVLSIIVYSSSKFLIHWFDDTTTLVKLPMI